MSKEPEPIRSRRELRQAQGSPEQSGDGRASASAPLTPAPRLSEVPRRPATGPTVTAEAAAGTPADAPAGVSSGAPIGSHGGPAAGQRRRRAADVPVDAPSTPSRQSSRDRTEGQEAPRERSSQTRARDRATLRAYKELSDPATSAIPVLPSRRTLRQAQNEGGRAPLTGLNSVVAPPEQQAPSQQRPQSAGQPGQGQQSPVQPGRGQQIPVQRGPVPQPPAQQVPLQQGPAQRVPAPKPPGAQPSGPQPPISQAASAQSSTPHAPVRGVPAQPSGGAAREPEPATGAMSVEAALAARKSLLEDTKDHLSQLPAAIAEDPLQVDLEVLAQQRALAERAAILNQRALAKERLAQASASTRSVPNDPTTAHNLAMVQPLEFIRVPGVDQPVMRPSGTSYVPVVTRQGSKTRPGEQHRPATRTGAGQRPGGERAAADRNASGDRAQGPAARNSAARTPAPPTRRATPERVLPEAGQTAPATWTAAPARRSPAPAERSAQRSGRGASPANRTAAWPAVGPFNGPGAAGAPADPQGAPSSDAIASGRNGSTNRRGAEEQGQNTGRANTLKRAEAVARSRSGQTVAATAPTRARSAPGKASRPSSRTAAPRAGAARPNPARVTSSPAAVRPVPTIRTQVPSQPYVPAEMPPLPAGSAHGLEPLDAVTAGLGRVQRNRLIQWGAIVMGGVALIAGLSMLIIGLAH